MITQEQNVTAITKWIMKTRRPTSKYRPHQGTQEAARRVKQGVNNG